MKLTKILISTLSVASLAFTFSCSNTASNNSTTNGNANKTNIVVVNSNQTTVNNTAPVSNTTPAANKSSNVNKKSDSASSLTTADEQKIEGELQQGKTESLILYFGEESGDYAAYCFANDSDAGRIILAACKNKDQCSVSGEVEPGGCKVPGLEADLSDSGRITKVKSAKKLPAKK